MLRLRALALAAGLAAAAAASAAATAAYTANEAPIVGAIRWDAWYADPGTLQFDDKNFGVVSRSVTYDMYPAKYHFRVPFFGSEVNSSAVTTNGNSAAAMGSSTCTIVPMAARDSGCSC